MLRLNILRLTTITGLSTSQMIGIVLGLTSLLLLMAIVGAMTLARRGGLLPGALVVPGDQVFETEMLDRQKHLDDLTPVATHSTAEAKRLLGVETGEED